MTADPHYNDVQQLLGLGMDYDQAERALKVCSPTAFASARLELISLISVLLLQRWPDVNTAAINYFEGNLDLPDLTTDDEPPPLIPVDDHPPPAYDAFGPQNYVESRIHTTPTPTSKEVALWGETL